MAPRPEPLLAVRDLALGFAARRSVLTAVSISFDPPPARPMRCSANPAAASRPRRRPLMRLLPAAGRMPGGTVSLCRPRTAGAAGNRDARTVRGRGMAMIFQEPATSLNPVLTVGPPDRRGAGAASRAGRRRRERATRLLTAVGRPTPRAGWRLSVPVVGRHEAAVMIAVALAGDPALLIADEPTTALDVTIQAQILDLPRNCRPSATWVCLRSPTTSAWWRGWRIASGSCTPANWSKRRRARFFFATPRHPYTQALPAALPDLAGPRGAWTRARPRGWRPFRQDAVAGGDARRLRRFTPRCRR